MDLSNVSDDDLEARLRQRAFDDFNAELQVDRDGPDESWRARCMTHDELGTANRFSVEGAATRRGALEVLWRAFEVQDDIAEWRRRH